MTYEEFDKRCDELENAPLQERKTFFADVLAGETEKTDVRMMAFFRYALLFYRAGDFLAAREILEPFIIDYKSYRYRPEIIACFNLVGVVAYYVQEYALSRFYIREGLKIAREHSEVSRYAYEYNNLAVTYLAQQDYEKALEVIREAEKNMPVSDEVMHAYIYRNLAEICCHLDRLDEAKDALAKCVAYRGREILPEEVRIVNTLLTYKAGDTAGYKRCCAELREHLPQLHAEEFLASCKVLFDCGMDAGDKAQVEWVLDAMDAYLRRDPKEAQVGLRAETCRYEYAKANGNTALMLAALEKKETYYALVLARKEEVRVRDAGRYLHIGQRLHNALESEAGANRTKTRFLANMSHDIRTPINGILGMLEVIRDCRSDEARVDDCLGKIDISAKHLLSLVNDVLVEWVLDAMDAYLRRDPKEAQVGLRAETCRYEYAKANGNTALMLAALEKKETYYALVLARKEEVRVRDAGRYLHIGQRLHNALESEAGANRTKTRFLANMSHDIRTPINGILGMLEVIRDCRSDEARVDDCLGKIDISAKHLLSLVNDVLDMSKIESNSFVVEAKPFNLARTLVEVDDIVRIQAEQSGLRLYTDHDDVHDADLLGSALYLKKILVNLYSNAIKYNKPGGSITTRLREVSRTADTAVYAFTIRDTGIGMTQDFIDNHLFEAFSQEDNAARSQYGGTGLGMSIVSQLVQKMNGTITVESTVGEGSCFTVTLPFAIDHDPPAAGPEKEASTDLHGKRLLVVEDNELNMEIAEFMLKSAGAEVVKAFDGESAVRAFAADPAGCDAILMDLMMPVMDGYAAAKAIRAGGQPRAGTVPIIAMSANAYAEDVKKCLDSGMNAHISKPLFKDVMLRTIARFV